MRLPIFAALVASACGESPAPAAVVSFELSLPLIFPDTVDCANRLARDSSGRSDFIDVRPVLYVSGDHEPCVLDFDDATLRASGTCGGIHTGAIWPVLLIHDLGSAFPLYYALSTADLRYESLGEGSEPTVTVRFDDVVYQQSEVSRWGGGRGCRESKESPEHWAYCQVQDVLGISLQCGVQSKLDRWCADGVTTCD